MFIDFFLHLGIRGFSPIGINFKPVHRRSEKKVTQYTHIK